MFTDPSGHSWLSNLWNKIKIVVSIIVAVVIAIYAPYLLAQYGGVAFGTTVAGATTLTFAGTVAVGALAGFASGAIMTGTLKGALKGALFGAIGAGLATGIGHGIGLEGAGNLFNKGVNAGKLFVKSALHGLSRGIISMAQGGTFKSGFASGFSSSFFSPGTELGGDNAGGFTVRTAIASIVGGTASSIGGGKFSNGAVSGAFVHMFNAEGDSLFQKVKSYFQRVESIAQANKSEYNKAYGSLATKAGEMGSGIIGVANANKLYNANKLFKQNIYTGKGGLGNHIRLGKPYLGTAIIRTWPAIVSAEAFSLGIEAGHYLPAYYEAW